MIFEAMIVDDEAPARVELINQLEQTGRVKVVSEAVCLQEGIAKMRDLHIDVAFIDHNIAGAGTAMLPEALASMSKIPLLIYMTAYSDFMDEPFGVDPLGYLVKPVDNGKLKDIIRMLDEVYSREVDLTRFGRQDAPRPAAGAASASGPASACEPQAVRA